MRARSRRPPLAPARGHHVRGAPRGTGCAGAVSWRGGRVRARSVLLLTSDGEKVIGPRFVRLLRLIDAHGSVRAAARELGLGYRHAIAWLQRAESLLERSLVARHAGGATGGGAALTRDGRAVVDAYDEVSRRIGRLLERAEARFFPSHR